MADVKLYCGDCLEILPTLPAGSVDVIAVDPPYGQSNEGYDKGINPAVWRECYRTAGDSAALVSFAGGPTYHRIASDIEAAGWRVRQMWAWIYRDGFITSAWPRDGFDRLAPAMDPICYATKGKVLLNLQRESGPRWQRLGNARGKPGYSTRVRDHGTTKANGHWPRTVIADEVPGFEYFLLSRANPALQAQRTGHPNQKPLELIVWLLDKLPGQMVLDFTMGSGTTGVACAQTGRSFIGIEINPDYFEMARQRIEQAQPALVGLRL